MGVEGGREGGNGGHTAAHVELCAAKLTGDVESDDFGAEEVVAGWDVVGDLHVYAAAAGVHVFSSPVISRTI